MHGSSWSEVQQCLEYITPICTTQDSDGIDIYFLNAPSTPYHKNITLSSTVREIFSTVRPSGSTPTGQRLNALLRPYLSKCSTNGCEATKPMNIIVITDGMPTDDLESVLISAAKKLDKMDAPAWQVGIQFFQVGNDEGAKRPLKTLDDELAGIAGMEVRDIVDTVPLRGRLEGDGILKVVLGAVNRRLDRRGQTP